MLLLQDLMNFVLSKAGQLLQSGLDAALSMSAAKAIQQVCEVAEANSMPMAVTTLDGLLQLIQQAAQPDVSLLLVQHEHSLAPACVHGRLHSGSTQTTASRALLVNGNHLSDAACVPAMR